MNELQKKTKQIERNKILI